MKIIAYLNTNEVGCNYSKHFTDHWINNEKLHPKCKEIPVEVLETEGLPVVYLMDQYGKEIHSQISNDIRPDLLQELILTL